MKIFWKTLVLLLVSQMSFAFTTPEVHLKLIGSDNLPIAGFPIILQTRQLDIAKILVPHSNARYVNMQRIVLSDKSGIAVMPEVFLLMEPKSITLDIGYAKSCTSQQGYTYEHERAIFMGADNGLVFKIASAGTKQGWICSLAADEKDSSDFEMGDLVCKSNLSAADSVAFLRAKVQKDKADGCTIETSF